METKEASTKISRNLKNFYLDPNNYRFVDKEKYKHVPDEKIIDVDIQKRTRDFIEGKHREGVKTLLDSFKANGFLDVDRIQVRELEDNKFLVLEGNRRITALKILQEDYQNGHDIGKFDSSIFKSVPSVIYEDNDENHLIIMGLKHISGPKMWPAVNQAQLIYDYLEPYQGQDYANKEVELIASLGISKHKLRNSQRAYHFIIDYKKSDYGDQFKSEMFSIFEEVTKKPTIKKWLGWDDKHYKANNKENKERFFSWISEYDDSLSETDEEESEKREPIISKSIEIRSLDKFITDEKAIEVMETTQSVTEGLISSNNLELSSYKKSMSDLTNNIEKISRFKDLIEIDDLENLKKSQKLFNDILPKTSSLDVQSDNVLVCFEKGKNNHFDSITIENYKVFQNFKLDNINRVNIFAGFNNTGKTSLLEAIYLLTKQNNMSSFFEMIRLKNKLETLNTTYLNDYFDSNIKIEGQFNKVHTKIEIAKYEALEIDKKDDYLASYKILSQIDSDTLENIAHTFEYNPLQRFYEKIEVLCNSIFKSPYFYNKNEIVNTHYKNVQLKEFSLIVDFIKEHIDTNINDIELTEKNDIKRFLVDTDIFPEKSVDITSYGEGLQRIFEIALSFAYCKNGVLLIDELETAIHYSLLVDFTKFIQELARKFNVQVFITSHSKECIDAFVQNNVYNEDISAFLLENKNGNITTKYIGGDRLKYLTENISLDIRGSTNE